MVASSDGVTAVPAFPIDKMVDTTGAGDLFAAGFLFGLVRGAGHEAAGRLGALAAAEVIQHIGARPQASLKELAQANGLPVSGFPHLAPLLSINVIARSTCDEAIHSFFVLLYGLLRGACHRARIRATRWLAMTARSRRPLPATRVESGIDAALLRGGCGAPPRFR